MPFFSFPNPFSDSPYLIKLKKGVLKVSIYPHYRTCPRPAELSPTGLGGGGGSGTAGWLLETGWDSGPSILFLNSLIDLLSCP